MAGVSGAMGDEGGATPVQSIVSSSFATGEMIAGGLGACKTLARPGPRYPAGNPGASSVVVARITCFSHPFRCSTFASR